ncbi:MAG: Lipoprotein LpqB beta-propeller protein [Jatrophihabitans sp.]|nr:Lipoprotein LpqB beta-propeller protein [Jatrophihabitans sp.]
MMRRHLVVTAAAASLVLMVSACTGVPSSSAPETIKPIPFGGDVQGQAITPAPGAQPSELVKAFLQANGTEPGTHTSARTFLTPDARRRWTDTTATIVSGLTIGTFKPGKPVVVVAGRVVGTLNAAGIYTPSLQRTGQGGDPAGFEYHVTKVGGQYRIDGLGKGLLLTVEQFDTYKPHPLYFYDLADRYLVPDVRWSQLESSQLEQWLVTQLAAGPRPDLQNAVNPDTLPTQASVRRISVTGDAPTKVEIPGAAQLNSPARNQLASQIGHTLYGVGPSSVLSITDGGTPVTIPSAASVQFTASGASDAGPPPPARDVYYLRSGRIYAENGIELSGAVNRSSYSLNSIALTRLGRSGGLSVAAVTGTGDEARLLVGSQLGGLTPVTKPLPSSGALTRPAWAPGAGEVWVGRGSNLYRVIVTGKAPHVLPIAIPTSAGGGRIVSLRLSPEGSRVAMVISAANGKGQLFVGSVVRTAGQVRIDTLQPVSPVGVVVQDVAWIEASTLYAIGYDATNHDPEVFETNVDGSAWSGRGIGSLQDAPDSVTVAAGQLAWVSAGGFIWAQRGTDWVSPGAASQTSGTAPIYLE